MVHCMALGRLEDAVKVACVHMEKCMLSVSSRRTAHTLAQVLQQEQLEPSKSYFAGQLKVCLACVQCTCTVVSQRVTVVTRAKSNVKRKACSWLELYVLGSDEVPAYKSLTASSTEQAL